MRFDKGHHFLVAPCSRIVICIVFCRIVFNQLVRTVSGFTNFTIHERIGKSTQMSGCHPSLRIHQNGAVQPHIIRTFLDEFFPPRVFDIVFQLHAQRTVVPSIRQSPVYFRTAVYNSAVFTQRNNFFHGLFLVIHVLYPVPQWLWGPFCLI